MLTVWSAALASSVHGQDQWATDPSLLAAVEANGLGGCTLESWDPRMKTLPVDSGPLLIPEGVVSWSSALERAQWERPAFLAAHGGSTASVRLASGQRQAGLVVRRATVTQYAAEARAGIAGGAEGVMFDRAPDSVLEATSGLQGPAVLGNAGLTSPVLSLGKSGSGLPFHNHGAAWLTVLAGKKLVVLVPPASEDQRRPEPGWQTLQHVPPANWAGADPVTSGSKLGEAGLSSNPTVRTQPLRACARTMTRGLATKFSRILGSSRRR